MTNQQPALSLDTLFALATAPDPATIDWKDRFAQLYTEHGRVLRQLSGHEAAEAARVPFADITQALRELAANSKGKVELVHEPGNTHSPRWRIWLGTQQHYCDGNSVADAIVAAREALAEHERLLERGRAVVAEQEAAKQAAAASEPAAKDIL
jgi:hypothetical protein